MLLTALPKQTPKQGKERKSQQRPQLLVFLGAARAGPQPPERPKQQGRVAYVLIAVAFNPTYNALSVSG